MGVDLDAQRDAVVHRDRQRLRAAHPAEAGGERDRAGERAAEAAAGDLGEALVRALQDALRADVDPRAGRHLAVHREAERFEAAELLPVPPLGDEVGVGDQHARRPLVGAEHADRLARLHQHRLVGGQRRERAAHRVEGIPRPRRATGAAVHDEVVGSLGDLRVEVVLQHAERGLLRPAAAGEVGAARGPHGSCASSHRVSSNDISGSTSHFDGISDHIEPSDRRLDRGQHGAGAHQLLGRTELGRQPPVGPGAVDALAQRGDRRARAGGRLAAATAARSHAPRTPARRPASGAGCRPLAAACARPPTPSRRGPPASRSSAASRRSPARRGACSPSPSRPACSGRSSARS